MTLTWTSETLTTWTWSERRRSHPTNDVTGGPLTRGWRRRKEEQEGGRE
jgi:hypothetical protein